MVEYDPNLEGTVLPKVPLKDDDPESIEMKTVRNHMREIATKMRRQQEVSINPGDPYEEIAFINCLLLLHQWCKPGIEKPNDVSGRGKTYHIKGNPRFTETIQKANILLWVRQDDGEKAYFNFKAFTREQIQNIFGTTDGRNFILEDYEGKVQESNMRDIREIGVSFYNYQNRRMRKSEKRDVPEGEYLDIEIYRKHKGAFFAFVPTIPVDLEIYGIYTDIKKSNYKDNCFIKACIESGVLEKTEIEALRSFIRLREVPRAKMREIADFIKCNFIIRTLDETKEPTHRVEAYMNTTKGKLGKDYGRTIDMVLWRDHYMINKPVKMTPFYIAHYEEITEKFADMPIEDRQMISNISGRRTRSKGYKLVDILIALHENNRLRPIYKCEADIITTQEYDNNSLQDYVDLEYNEELCCKPVLDDKPSKQYDYVIYADFESDITVNPHKAYLCCAVWRDKDGRGKKRTFRGYHCGSDFLDFVPDNSLVYFHNLKYDASFFINQSIGTYNVNMIDHAGKIMMLKFRQIKGGNKQFTVKDSYSVISKPLRAFGPMFNLEVHKEVCPYNVYTANNIRKRFVPLAECLADIPDDSKEAFMDNCKQVGCYYKVSDSVDIMTYAEFYCVKDCVVLMLGMEHFNDDLAKVFASNGKQWIGVESYLSISAIGYDFTIKYGCMEGVYALAGKPQDFISKCVSGGRTMCANNEKQLIEARIQDFDAVSLYPSAMSIMPGIPLGKPKVITDLRRETIMTYDEFYIEINITKIKAKGVDKYRFPLVFTNIDGTKIFEDKTINNFYIDKRGLMDLEYFYDIEYDILRGYYFNEGFNTKINDLIRILFDLRAKYKKEGNPLQETIKLLLNSIYGKSILKPIKTDTKIIDPNKLEHFINLNYNFIKEIHEIPGNKKVKAYAKMIKPINHHFNVPQFGVGVLSWSKHIMNEVMCLADQKGLEVYYQDTDSLHIKEEDVAKLQEHFKETYGRELIGKNLCQFHCDFDPIKPGVPVHSKKLIALGKKCYIDLLEDEEGNTSYHIRMKGIPEEVIKREAEKREISIEDLYMLLYKGESITFNMKDGSNCFRKNDFYQMITPSSFTRTIKF